MGSSVKIAQHLEHVFKPYCMMFKELKVKKQVAPTQCFCKYQNIVFWGGIQLFMDFCFSQRSWNLTLARS
jgi:hypothetical protein